MPRTRRTLRGGAFTRDGLPDMLAGLGLPVACGVGNIGILSSCFAGALPGVGVKVPSGKKARERPPATAAASRAIGVQCFHFITNTNCFLHILRTAGNSRPNFVRFVTGRQFAAMKGIHTN